MSKQKPNARHELKYIIQNSEYLVLRDRLKTIMPLDNFADPLTRTYHIRSMYFDDIYNTAMWEKMDGIKNRKKWRIRIYNFSDKNIKLEKKEKYDKYTVKQSTRMTRQQVDNILIHNNIDFLFPSQMKLYEEIYSEMRVNRLKPVVIVDYQREAYTYPAGNIRITFDRNLHSGNFLRDMFRESMMPVPILDAGMMILEIKYDYYLPPHIRDVLTCCNGLRSAMSKYAMCRMYH